MKNRIILTFAAILGFASVAFAQDFRTKSIRHDGIEREYRLFVPDSIAPERPLVKDLNLNKLNCFLCGMSNGGEMCYLTALQRPEEFTAYGSVAGLTMEWFYRKYSMRKAVPFLEVHGDADKTSRWEGDPDNTGGWGEYIAVPIAVKEIFIPQ